MSLSPPRSTRASLRVLIVLAVAQIIGWGSVGLTAVVAPLVATDLGMDLAAVFAGNSILYATMGLSAPILGRAFVLYGARTVMIAGSALAGPGFVGLALAAGSVSYCAAWIVLGVAGSATLTNAANILLNEIAGRGARRAIAALMLVTGLSSSLFWPTTAFLTGLGGWRATCLVYAGAMWVLCLPLYRWGIPPRARYADGSEPAPEPPQSPPRSSTFWLIACGLTLNAFVTFGLNATLIALLVAEGLSRPDAVGYGAMLGIVQVGARGIDFLGGGRWDGLTSGLFAGILVVTALLLLAAGGETPGAVMIFILIYGLGSGVLAVVRATLPLAFYDRAAYACAASRIALPLNLVTAAAPPVLAIVLTTFGREAVLLLTAGCVSVATALFLALTRRRPAAPQPLTA
ncbi:Predicted arabinose efflux permease, MFS family [Methylobacterium phyllostachyos]|uniref:Predicted arabinose efflux permease, MFS family n=1 Tax=Methylobacterium phyllostachyos TaxID=582672 RepID=A0A1G9R5Y3_9HYPH|nr:MFS transporter [Methylobacterium phyllostachyos]SDM18716.1 Predicted arabinose efflux permease, MFS family [Methylobacterium phyllostachyos]